MIALVLALLPSLGGEFEGTLWRGREVIGQVSVVEDGDTRTLRTGLGEDLGDCEWLEVQTLGDRPGRPSRVQLAFTPQRSRREDPASPPKGLRAEQEGNAVLLSIGAVQQRIRVDDSGWFLHHREHLVGLFDLVDGVPRVTDVRRSFDGVSAGTLKRGRWTAWYEGVQTIESARHPSSLALHAFRIEAPGMRAQVYMDREGGWARLEALGDELPGLILENDHWDRLVPMPSRPPAAEVAGEVSVRFKDAAGHDAGGRLVLPVQAEGQRAPAVLFLWGAGAHDANGNGRDQAPPRGAPFLDLVRALADLGVASLRLSETGDLDQGGGRPLSARRATAVAALEFLSKHEGVDPGRLAVLGHSEGCLVAAHLASRAELAGTVWVAPPDQPLPELLREQWPRILRRQGAGESMVEEALASLHRFLAALPESAATDRAATTETGWWNYGGVRWWVEHRDLKPLELAAAVRVPVLLVNGDRDLNVTPEQAEAWHGALAEAGQVSVELLKVKGADHFLVPNPSGDPMRAAETDRAMDPAAVRAIRDWLWAALGHGQP